MAAVALLAGSTVAPSAALAEPPLSPKLADAGWRAVFIPGIRKTRFALRPDGSLTVSADRSFGLIYRMVTVTETRKRHLHWKWRLESGPSGIDLTRKGKDDRPIAIHVWFPARAGETATSNWLSRLRDRLSGLPKNGWSLSYVWGGAMSVGAILPNPYHRGRGKIIVLRTANAKRGRWYREKVDLARDFRRAFGFRAPAVAYIGLSADMDDQGGMSQSQVAAIRMVGGGKIPAKRSTDVPRSGTPQRNRQAPAVNRGR